MLSDAEQRKRVRPDPRHGLRRALHGGRRRRSGGFEDVFGGMFGQGAAARAAEHSTTAARVRRPARRACSAAAAVRPAERRLPRLRRPDAGRDVTARHDARLPHRDRGRDHHAAERGRQADQGQDPGRRRRRSEDPAARARAQPSPDGGEPGDLVVTVTVRKHPVFERDGLNLRVDVPVTFAEAALGATIEVPTLGGDPVKLRVAAGHPVRPRAARQGSRRHDRRRAPATCSPTVQVAVPSHLRRRRARGARGVRRGEPDENPRADLLAQRAQRPMMGLR